MTQAVTELIVRGDGALATLDKFEDKMVAAGRATDQVIGSVARYEAVAAKMNAAQEKGLAISTQRIARISAEQRGYEQLAAKTDPLFALRIKQEREAEQMAVKGMNARLFAGAQEADVIRMLTKLDQQHAVAMQAAIDQQQLMAAGQRAVAGRYDATTSAINRQTSALGRNHSVGSFNTANIAAQFQDIGVTAAMGMSPLQIALQQGTQLSAVFEQMKASGQSVGSGLRTAFMSIISPMSLVTVGAIAVTAAVVQFAGSLAGKANPEAEEFSKWLEKIGSDANTAAEFLERVNKAVHDLTVVDLNKLQRQGQAYIDQQRAQLANPLMEAAGWEGALNDPKFVETYNLIDKVLGKLRRDDGFKNLDDLHKSLSAIVAERPDLQKLAEDWEELGEAILKAKAANEANARASELALHGMQAYQARDGAAMQKYLDQNVETLRELRKEREAAFAQLYAKSPSELAAAARKQAEMDRDPTQSPDANKYREDTAAALAYAQAIKQITDANEARLRSLDQTLLSQKLETALIGAGVRLRAAASLEFQQMMEIHEEAIRNGITSEKEFQEVYGGLIAKIHERAKAYGEEAEAAAKANLERNLAFERAQLGRTDVDQRVAAQLRDLYGDKYIDHMNGAIAGQIRYNEELAKTGEFAQDAFGIIIDALTSSGDLADNLIKAFAQIGKMFAQIGQQKFFDYITGKSSSLFGDVSKAMSAPVGGGVSVASMGREVGRAMAQPISDRFAGVGEDLAANIHAAADTLGISARDLATVISYETGGTFDPNQRGGAGGRHLGLIQFGPAEQKHYGVAIGQALSDQMQAVVAYLQDRGLKPGMDLLDLYSTINAGRPGLYNRSDAANGGAPGTVADKVAGMGAHQSVADRILGKQAVSDGMMDYTRRIQSTGNMGDQFDTSGPGSVAGMSKMQGLLGVGGAAIGAFAGGYESGSPLGGALNGAMAGAGAAPALAAMGIAGPVGIIGGAILGFIGGILGKAKQKREELKKAQQELEGQIGAITNLMRTATHNYLGAMEKEFGDTVDEFQKAITLAEKAKNSKLVQQLKESQQEFFDRLVNDWNKAFQGTLDSLNAGLGMDGQFLKGMDAVDKMRESLIGFVNDAKFFAEADGDLSSMLDARKKELGIGQKDKPLNKPKDDYTLYEAGHQNPGTDIHNVFVEGYKDLGLQLVEKGFEAFNDQGGQLYTSLTDLTEAAEKFGFAIDEDGKVTRVVNESIVDAVRKAQEAAQQSALASLSGGKTFTEIEEAIQRLQGAAASLPELLTDLGMSAEEAAEAIDRHLNMALDSLRRNYIDGLNSSINDLSDFGFLNEIIAAQEKYSTRLIETAALGLDGSLALKEFNLSLAKTIKGADLTEKQIDMLAAAFPAIAGIMDMLSGDDVIQQVEDAKSALQAAYDKEKSAIEQTISRLESFTKAIKTFRDEMRLNSSSPLGQKDQVDEAAKQFRDIAQKAMGGDEDAMDKLTGVSQSYLDEAREYYASSEDYFKIWNEVDKTLSDVEAKAGSQLTQAQKQLEALDKQVAGLININDSVLTVAQAIANLNVALGARDTALQNQINAAKDAGQTYDPFVTSLYKSVLNRAPDAEGAAYYTAFLHAGMSHDDLRKKFIANAQPEIDRGYPQFASGGIVGRYAEGGMVGNGLYNVDSVLARYAGGGAIELAGGEHVTRATSVNASTYRALDYINRTGSVPKNDNSDVVAAIGRLEQQNRELKGEVKQLRATVAMAGTQTVQAVERGNEISRGIASGLNRVGARV